MYVFCVLIVLLCVIVFSVLLSFFFGLVVWNKTMEWNSVVPRHRLSTVGRWAFAAHGPMVWNSLRDDLRAQQDYESFRQRLKTWLFSNTSVFSALETFVIIALYKLTFTITITTLWHRICRKFDCWSLKSFLSTDMAKQTIIYVKCCADWFICVIVFCIYCVCLISVCYFFHLCCATVVERRSLAGELSLTCARPAADGWPLMWVSHPL